MYLTIRTACFIWLFLSSVSLLAGQVVSWQKDDHEVQIELDDGTLVLTPLGNNAIRVRFSTGKLDRDTNLILTEHVETPNFQVNEDESTITLRMEKIAAVITRSTGTLHFEDALGNTILSEEDGGRMIKPSTVQGEPTYIVEQRFVSPEGEYLYGTGQFQDGYLNIRNLPRRLTQVNTQISIPFVMSSKGYGLLWHNYGLTDFNPADQMIELVPQETEGKSTVVDVTTTEGTKKETRQDGVFTGSLTVEEDGQYAILLDVGSKMAKNWQVSVDGEEVISLKNHWLPPTTSALLQLSTGEHDIVVVCEKKDSPVIYYRKVTDETVFRSPVADKLDYVVFAGNPDEVISSYRNLTGKAPLMPIWSMGYIHCRERFRSQDELLENAKEFRARELPLDLIVQDWQYWGKYGWNAMQFDEDLYPDPAKMVKELHDMNMHLMLSVWSKIDKNSALGKEFEQRDYYIPNTQWIDFFNPDAAKYYWENFSEKLLKPYQIDAWWQDATEPENDDLVGRRVNHGTIAGEQFRNVYPLLVTKTVYEGSRTDAPDKRVFILTRSGFPGQQRYAAAVWTGDVGNDWETLRRQITAGLNYSITGMPWWTFDAGGFFRPGNEQYKDVDFHERFLRWFQFATFCPLQRVHGYQTNTEFWRYGDKVEKEGKRYLNLRYRLLPYIYSQAADITFNNGTLMRPLVMDFANDVQALNQKYEYMFGPSFLVAPVVNEAVKTWDVYLPQFEPGWYNFWTEKKYEGGQTVNVEAPIEQIPLFIKSGSIIPLGPEKQYSLQKSDEPIDIRIYPGSDGYFNLYEDDGVSYDYEKGKYSIIPLSWNDKKKELTIGARAGSYKGESTYKIFNVVICGTDDMQQYDFEKIINYSGKHTKINF